MTATNEDKLLRQKIYKEWNKWKEIKRQRDELLQVARILLLRLETTIPNIVGASKQYISGLKETIETSRKIIIECEKNEQG